MANKKVVVDPVTRIEGHLRMQAVLDENNVIVDAMSTGTMWRGLEVILKGRDPRDAWAFVERVCGVCTGIHALSAVRAVEDALGIQIPKNANIIRNLMNATLYSQDHLTHFYQLHGCDWIDVVSALSADPKKTSEIQQSISTHALSSPAYFKEVQDRLKAFVASGQLGIFANAYWGNPAYKLPPEINLLGVTHYLESLDFQREIVKVHAIVGGKNPHPNYLVGGVPCPINMSDTGAQGIMINQVWMNFLRDVAKSTIRFIDEVYYPDLMAMQAYYKDWYKIGGGLANKNLLCYGDFPAYANDMSEKSLVMPNGAVIDGKFDQILPVDLKDPNQIKEFVDHSWYSYPKPDEGLHPWEGITDPNFDLQSRRRLRRHQDRHQVAHHKRPLLLDQSSEMERTRYGNRSPCTYGCRLRQEDAAPERTRRPRSCSGRRTCRSSLLHTRPYPLPRFGSHLMSVLVPS